MRKVSPMLLRWDNARGMGVRRLCLLLLMLGHMAPALAAPAPDIRSSVPDSFEDLVDADSDVARRARLSGGAFFVEVYVDGQRTGDAVVQLSQNILFFDNPQAVVSRIPNLSNPIAFELLLETGLNLEADNVCVVRGSHGCHQPRIGTLGFVLDSQGSRLDIFRSYRFIQPPAPLTPSHRNSSLGAVAGLTFRGTGRTGDGSQSARASLTFDLTSGMGANSAFARGAATDDGRVFLRQAGAQRFYDRYRAAAGLFLTSPSDHLSQLDIIGAEWHTTDLTAPPTNTRDDTPILLFLDEESHVDIIRGGEILLSGRFPAGPVRLPTERLPNGSYSVQLRITDPTGNVREETRFFSRINKYRGSNRWQYGAQLGVTRDANRIYRSYEADGEPYVALWANRQIGDRTLIAGRLGQLQRIGFVEASMDRYFEAARLRASGLVTGSGGYSLFAQASGRFGKTSLSSQLRRSDIVTDSIVFQRRRGRFTEANVNISRELPGLGGTMSGFARYLQIQETGGYSALGASWSRSFDIFSPNRNGNIAISFQHNSRDDRILFRFRIVQRRDRFAASAELSEIQSYGHGGYPDSLSTRQLLQASWRSSSGSPTPWTLTSRLSDSGDGNGQFGAYGQFVGQTARFDMRADRSFGASNALSYSGSLATTVALSPSGLAFTSAANTRSGIIITPSKKISGDIESTVNGMERKQISGRRSFRPVASFKPQKVSFRVPKGSRLGYDGRQTEVRAFPGNVVRVAPVVFQQVTIFARLISSDGSPLASASLADERIASVSDDLGFMIADLRDGQVELSFRLADGGTCRSTLPELEALSELPFVDLGDLLCDGADASD